MRHPGERKNSGIERGTGSSTQENVRLKHGTQAQEQPWAEAVLSYGLVREEPSSMAKREKGCAGKLLVNKNKKPKPITTFKWDSFLTYLLCLCTHVCVWGGNSWDLVLFYLCGFQGLSSGCQACWQIPLLAGPYHYLISSLLL